MKSVKQFTFLAITAIILTLGIATWAKALPKYPKASECKILAEKPIDITNDDHLRGH